ncbi:MAG: hypothetical protein WBM43_04100, partial [Flavobacteriaceae bacterium]
SLLNSAAADMPAGPPPAITISNLSIFKAVSILDEIPTRTIELMNHQLSKGPFYILNKGPQNY